MAGRYEENRPFEFPFGSWSYSTDSDGYGEYSEEVEFPVPETIEIYDCNSSPKFVVKPLFEKSINHVTQGPNRTRERFKISENDSIMGFEEHIELTPLEEEEEETMANMVIEEYEDITDSDEEESPQECSSHASKYFREHLHAAEQVNIEPPPKEMVEKIATKYIKKSEIEDLLDDEEEEEAPTVFKSVMEQYELIPETSIPPQKPQKPVYGAGHSDSSSSDSDNDDEKWEEDDPTVYENRNKPQKKQKEKPFVIKDYVPVKYVSPDEPQEISKATKDPIIMEFDDTPSSLFEYISEVPESGSPQVVSIVLTVVALHNISVPVDVKSLTVSLGFSVHRCVDQTVSFVSDTWKKGKYTPKKTTRLLVHTKILPNVILNIHLMGGGRILAQTRFIVIDKTPAKSGRHLLRFSQRPTGNCEIKHKNLDPCIELQLASVSAVSEKKLETLPPFLIVPDVATNSLIVFRELLAEQRRHNQKTEPQFLSLFRVILGDVSLMKKLDKRFTEAMKKAIKEKRSTPKLEIFMNCVLKTIRKATGNKIPPFHTREIVDLRV